MAETSQNRLNNDESVEITPQTSKASVEYIGKWNQLVSTTNWDKGEVIIQWREALEKKDSAASQVTDEAWSQLVGGVTPQHVGRLRRTYERFGHVYLEYKGIYWSHFYAALEWDDAEMWLEGAVQSDWSVSKMRQHRWETLGKVGEKPGGEPISATEEIEETQSLNLSERTRNNDRDYIEGPVHEGPDWGDESPTSTKSRDTSEDSGDSSDMEKKEPDTPAVRPFASFTDLPDDVMDAANEFKVSIIRHKADEWSEIPKADMLELLDALKQLVDASA